MNGRTTPAIVFLTRDLDIGGAQRQLIELASGLHRLGWKVIVATFYGGGRLEPRLLESGAELCALEKSGRWDLPGFVRRLVSLVRRERPDIVHGYLDTPNLVLALLKPWLKQARVVWGVRASNMDTTRYDWLAAVESRLAALFSRGADLIICNSEAGRVYHEGLGYPPAKLIVIPNGVDTQRFRPDPAARDALRKEWGIGDQEMLIGVVARLDPMKDHRTFLKAAARTAALHRHVKFVCVGEGARDYREALESEAAALGIEGRVVWCGARDDVPRVYNALDLLVSSSLFGEGFPNVIVEAMATGVGCVATDVGDTAAIVGTLGRVCPPGDAEALAAAICDAIAHSKDDAAALREQVCARYGAARLIERTAAELARIAAPRSSLAARS